MTKAELARRVLRPYVAIPWWLRVLVPFLVAGALWYLSSRPAEPGPAHIAWMLVHNCAHVVAYAILGASILLAFPEQRRRRACIPSILLSAVYGALDELHQSYVPGRVVSVADLVSDGIGAALAVAALSWLMWDSERGLRALPWLCFAAVVSVSLATWSPW